MENKLIGLTVTEWLAIIGAFAWVPVVYKLISDYFKKPKITIVTGSQVEIGFSTFGPIVNIDMAILSENKKALVTELNMELVHENNDTQKFSWTWFEEVLYAMDIPESGSIRTRKNQNATAIMVGIDEMVEKKVGFQQNNFRSEYSKLQKELLEDAIEYSLAGKKSEELKLTHSYRAMHDLVNRQFIWKEGMFKLKITARLLGEDVIASHNFEFNLRTLDVKLLKNNIELCIIKQDQEFINNEIEMPRNWAWVNAAKL